MNGVIQTPIAFVRVWFTIATIWLARIARRVSRHGPRAATRSRIEDDVGQWPGVTVGRHRYGGVEFRLGRRELGHLHGDYLADLPFPVHLRRELVSSARAMPHHILPHSGWVSYPICDPAAADGAVALFRLAYTRALAADRARASRQRLVAGARGGSDARAAAPPRRPAH